MKNESVGDLQLCVKEANLFHKLAHCLDANNPIDLIYGSCYPFAVNLAFACELYLKAIMIFLSEDNTFKRGHKLADLFDKLPEDIKEEIAKSFLERTQNKYSIYSLLESHNCIFQQWRYAFEEGSDDLRLNYTGLVVLGNILKEKCNELI